MNLIGQKAKNAVINKIDSKTKNKVLQKYISLIEKNKNSIIRANKKDIKFAIKKKLNNNLIDRLRLNYTKLNSVKNAIKNIINLKDPIDNILEKWKRPNGLIIKRVSIPIGVIGVIYESRPNVTSDVSSLCFKSGNAVILRGGSEALNTNKILATLFRKALSLNKVDANYVQFINNPNRKYVDYMLSKMNNLIDVIIPRGGKNLVKKVQDISNVPIIGHLEGICHTFVDRQANLKMATDIIYNAKLRNTSICGATETILLHKKIVKKYCNPILKKLEENNCKIIGDKYLKKFYEGKIISSTNILKILKKRKQSTKVTGFIMGSGKIYSVTLNGYLIVSSPVSGKAEYFKKIGDPITSAPIINNGKLYILTKNSRIFGFN